MPKTTSKRPKYRVLGREDRSRCPRCRREYGTYLFPMELLKLAEDIQTLEDMLRLLSRISPDSISGDPHKDDAYTMLRRLAFLIGEMKRIAQHKLCYDYNSGEKIIPLAEPLTVAEVWQILLERVDEYTEKHIPRQTDCD